MATGQAACPCCGGTNLEEDSVLTVVACVDCGTVQQGELTDTSNYLQRPAATFNHSRERSKEQIRTFSDKDYASKKLDRLVKQTVKMAEAVKLSKSQSSICVEQARELNKRGAIGRSMRIDRVSAALVFIAWKRENASVSAWDMVKTGIKPHTLLKTTNRLCNEHSDLLSITQSEPLTDEERLTLRLDRFSPIPADDRKRVLSVAQDIWSVVINVKVQEQNIRKVPVNDYCILAVALEYVRRKALPKSEITKLAENLSMTRRTIETRLWVIKKALLILAARCPCLEQDVKDRVITTMTVQRYLDRIIQNKEYLVAGMEQIKEESDLEAEEGGEDDESTSEKKKQRRKRVRKSRTRISMGPVVLADGESGYHREGEGEGEGEGTLSDLLESEIDEYILTEQEVEFRKYLLSTEDMTA